MGIHAFRVEQSRHEFRSFLQHEEMESLMLDIFNLNYNFGNPEVWWHDEVRCWRYPNNFLFLQSNLNSWSF